jgi:phospholipase C
VRPFHFTSLTENGGDPYHNWTDTHNEWDHGKMDGFYTNDGQVAMGYIHIGQNMIKSIVTAVQKSKAWASTAILITWDEEGGFFDHIAPPQLDAFGPGLRVPMIVVSPLAKPGHVDTTFSEHSSVLKFIEKVFGLPTLASTNHQFDTSTPRGSNYERNGAPFPPRVGNSKISDLTQCFTVPVAGPAR